MSATRRAVHAEWTKLRTMPSTAWLLAVGVIGTVMAGAAATASVDTSHCPSPIECYEDTTRLSLSGVWLGQIAVVVLAVLTMTNEYSTGMIQTTLWANPSRRVVLQTKATVVTAAALAIGAVGVLGSLVAGRLILPGNGFTSANGYPALSLTDPPTLRAAAGTVLYLGLIALLSFGLGVIVRDTAVAITTILTLLYMFPVLAQLATDTDWQERINRFGPMSAGLVIQATRGLDRLPIGPWAGLGVLAAYAAASMLLAVVLFTTRDA